MNSKLLLSPWAIAIGLASGVILGVFYTDTALAFAPAGQLYLLLLQMCVLPIMTSAVITSLGRLVASKDQGISPLRVAGVFFIGLLIASVVGVAAALVLQPGNALDSSDREMVGRLMSAGGDTDTHTIATDLEITFFTSPPPPATVNPLAYLANMVPENVFQSLSQGHSIQILVFSILFGIALGILPPARSVTAFDFFDAVFAAFSRIISGLMYLLPFGLCALVAEQATRVGRETLEALLGFIIAFGIAGVLLLIVSFVIIWVRARQGFSDILLGLKDTIVIALGTRSGLAAIPSAIEALHERFGFERTGTNLVIPLGITICRHGTIMIFALTALFLCQLYQIEIGFRELAIVIFGSVIAGMASAGAPGIVAISMLSLVLEPLGLPIESAFILLLALDPITDPLLTLVNVQSNCAASTLITPRENGVTCDEPT
ncbi:dicarboxylate/amino acid:cation symporter [Chrysiogenes arsenatis]|uniref:dicarboxylate/amino acid:cation symporter n=1 Tax=Chrysiogenes arsenatis TaxID=309797 RepID=UPI000429C2D7|nr:cation:dicarboxylase symporter family transporter [Chrysiogenes arsenatis]